MKTKDPRDIIFAPVVSEKSYDLIEDANTYTFLVDPRSNKTEIKQAIGEIFNVGVVRVNVQTRKGKLKRTGWVMGRRRSAKRALVKLAPGDSIDIFGV
jgi:large subunit ribosomal protein L23